MNVYQTLIFLMSFAVVLVGIAQKLRIPYPIALVIGGALISFIPGISRLYFDPNLLLLLVLPPVLYYAAFGIAFQEFRRNWKDIFSLALGLVIASTFIIAVIFKMIFPQYSWGLAIAFGAIVSPPDAVAAVTILRRFGIGSRLQTILEGESLINDASALVLYRLAVVALVTGTFSMQEAGQDFIFIVLGGIVVGIITGVILQRFSKGFLDPVVGSVFSFTIPYITYVIADDLGVSGVLAVVVNGLIGSRILVKHHSSLRRVLGYASWDLFNILLNCFIFILIGSELRVIAEQMSLEDIFLYTGYGVLFTLVLIAVRMAWVYSDLAFFHFHSLRKKSLISRWHPSIRDACLIGWAGMRGIVSLAAALALPFSVQNGSEPLPGRDAVIFITFIVIFLTLIIPGLTLPILIKWLKIKQKTELEVSPHIRKQLIKIGNEELENQRSAGKLSEQEHLILSDYFSLRHQILQETFAGSKTPNIELARMKVIQAQRDRLFLLWEEGVVDDTLLRTIEEELDMEEQRSPRGRI